MTQAMRKTSGSEKRQRQRSLNIRMTDAELAEIEAKANDLELAPSSYARMILLDSPPPRARRKPSVEVESVAKVLAQLGKIGSNINQIAHALNANVPVHPAAIEFTLKEVNAMRDACLEALNRKP